MKKHRFKYLFLGLVSALVLDAGTNAQAFSYIWPADAARSRGLYINIETMGNDVLTGYQDPVHNEDLDEMRGGFVTSSGMVIDFSFAANTLIDGRLINQVVLNTADIGISADSLRRIIQVGEGNTAFGGAADMNSLPNILTVVQNNMDNVAIQQLNMLDLTVRNMHKFINGSIASEIDFQNTMGLPP